MAYDPEARETSNNAMIIGVVALVLVVLGALAYYATRQPDTTVVAPTQVTRETVIEKEVPSTTTPNTVIVTPGASSAPAPAPAPRVDTKVTVDARPAAPAPAPAPAPASKTETNVTVNTPPATKAPAGDAATSDSTGTPPAPKY